MAKEAAGEYRDFSNGQTARVAPLVLARLVMLTSWGAGLVLAWTTVVSPDIRWRLIAMFMSVLVLAPTLMLGFRQLAGEIPAAGSENAAAHVSISLPEDASDDGKSGTYVDQPTGLASRRYLMMFLQRELSRSARSRACLSLAIFDIHEFHKLGEEAGAEAATTGLADVGARLKSILREYDLVARYAAGRLAVVLPEADARSAAEVVERLHELATSVCVNGSPLSVTVGLASSPEHGANAEELINSAHRALNRGKFSAANRVHLLGEMKQAS